MHIEETVHFSTYYLLGKQHLFSPSILSHFAVKNNAALGQYCATTTRPGITHRQRKGCLTNNEID